METLSDNLQSRGLKANAALFSVWKYEVNQEVELDKLLGNLFSETSLLTLYLDLVPKSESLASAKAVVVALGPTFTQQIVSLASEYNNLEVNEIHAFLAMSSLHEEAMNRISYAPLPPMEVQVDEDPGSQKGKLSTRVANMLGRLGQPLKTDDPSVAIIRVRLREYLESSYFPYGSREWERYQVDCLKLTSNSGQMRDNVLKGFAARRVKEQRVNATRRVGRNTT